MGVQEKQTCAPQNDNARCWFCHSFFPLHFADPQDMQHDSVVITDPMCDLVTACLSSTRMQLPFGVSVCVHTRCTKGFRTFSFGYLVALFLLCLIAVFPFLRLREDGHQARNRLWCQTTPGLTSLAPWSTS